MVDFQKQSLDIYDSLPELGSSFWVKPVSRRPCIPNILTLTEHIDCEKNCRNSGLYRADVINVDKQDDGAARRFFHAKGLRACTEVINGKTTIRKDFKGIFVYLFALGLCFRREYMFRH